MSGEKSAALALVPKGDEQRAGLARTTVNITGLGEVFRFAAALAQLGPGVVPKAYAGNENAIAACIVTGAELGIGAMESLRSIYLVDGKPQLAADLMMRIAIQRGVTIEWPELSDTNASAIFRRPGFPDHRHSWSMADAQRAGLAGKDVWKKYPRAMLRSRCVSEALRAWAPDVLGAGVYVEGEFDSEQQPQTVTATVMPVAPKSAPVAKASLADAKIGDELHAMCSAGAEKMRASNGAARERFVAAVTKHAARLSVDADVALEWAGLAAPRETPPHDPETGEVAPDQEPPDAR